MKRNYRMEFPLLLSRQENGTPIAYLDNAATTQKPAQVIEAMKAHYEKNNANPHRGAYTLSADATEAYESARKKVAQFIGAASEDEIIFTKNTTEALNLVAWSYGMKQVGEGDEILISVAEHHSNLIPWQRVAAKTGAALQYLYTDSSGDIPREEWEGKLTPRTKILAITHTSNVLGIENPISEMVKKARSVGAAVVLDGAQGVPHTAVNVQALDVDFMAFSGHKMYGPEGIGVLYGKGDLLEKMEPLLLGGGIVEEVTQQSVRLLPSPNKFEAGTPNVAAAVGLGAAIDYISQIGMEKIQEREATLGRYLAERLQTMPEVTLYGGRPGSIVAFNVKDAHPHDVASILDADGVTVRAGHHCAQPLMGHLGINACCRASIALYNTEEEIDRLANGLGSVRRWLGL